MTLSDFADAVATVAIACGNADYADEKVCPTCDGRGHVSALRQRS